MSPIEASCPACGAPITFKIGSSIVVVCDFCHSVVARGDRRLEDLGKVAELVETGSPLDVGLTGVYQGVAYELTGRAQLGHEAGGIWDEWYAAFADGRWGWLAEAQGRFYMTVPVSLPEQTLLPPFEMLHLGGPVAGIPGSLPFVVAEKGRARMLGAKGEIPYRVVPGEEYEFADLSGPQGRFATLDYSEQPPLLFIGREVTYAELGLPITARAAEREARRVQAVQLSCPQCGGPLDLRAPDRTERVTCPNCGSLLDVSQGRLEFLKALQPGKVVPIIPIGSVGELAGEKLTVIGFLQRSVEFEGVRYFWEEYLLYNPQVGFRWLVRSDDHWSFVQTIPPGDVIEEDAHSLHFSGRSKKVRLLGKRFKLYQDAIARVEYVAGEFYWKVNVGELVRAIDYIHPPLMLSKEASVISQPQVIEEVAQKPKKGSRRKQSKPAVETGEINWSLGTYIKRRDVEKAFAVAGLPDSNKIAPNQPFLHKKVYKYWFFLLLATILLGFFILGTGPHRKVFEQNYPLEKLAGQDQTQVRFSDPFELKSRQNIKVSVSSNVDNSWFYVEGDLIDEATGLVQAFSIPVEYYHGVEGGESWSEGGNSSSVHLSSLPGGRYTLRLEASWQNWQQPATMNVRVEQGVPRLLHFFLALIGVSIIPLVIAIYHWSFEKRRWDDSEFSPFRSE